MIDPALLKCLCCPESHQPLREADAAFVSALNQRIALKSLRTRSGKIVTLPIEGALLRDDGAIGYPIRGRLPILLIAEAIELNANVEKSD